MRVVKTDLILDVGGSPYFWEGSGLEYNVTILNVSLPSPRSQIYHWVQGDACDMPMFDNQSFDIVFSNSVIEHVGDLDRQLQMAEEIRRVGKRYWVQTPYKHFPVEPHFVFPFFQYLPYPMRIFVAQYWPFSFAKRQKRDPRSDVDSIWLLNNIQMKALFNDSIIHEEKLLGMTKSIIAYRS